MLHNCQRCTAPEPTPSCHKVCDLLCFQSAYSRPVFSLPVQPPTLSSMALRPWLSQQTYSVLYSFCTSSGGFCPRTRASFHGRLGICFSSASGSSWCLARRAVNLSRLWPLVSCKVLYITMQAMRSDTTYAHACRP